MKKCFFLAVLVRRLTVWLETFIRVSWTTLSMMKTATMTKEHNRAQRKVRQRSKISLCFTPFRLHLQFKNVSEQGEKCASCDDDNDNVCALDMAWIWDFRQPPWFIEMTKKEQQFKSHLSLCFFSFSFRKCDNSRRPSKIWAPDSAKQNNSLTHGKRQRLSTKLSNRCSICSDSKTSRQQPAHSWTIAMSSRASSQPIMSSCRVSAYQSSKTWTQGWSLCKWRSMNVTKFSCKSAAINWAHHWRKLIARRTTPERLDPCRACRAASNRHGNVQQHPPTCLTTSSEYCSADWILLCFESKSKYNFSTLSTVTSVKRRLGITRRWLSWWSHSQT